MKKQFSVIIVFKILHLFRIKNNDRFLNQFKYDHLKLITKVQSHQGLEEPRVIVQVNIQ